MSALLPVAVYGLKVPAGDVMMPALLDFPATFRITMAAIDPSAEPEDVGTAKAGIPPRATLKMVYGPPGADEDSEDSEDEDDEEDYLRALLAGQVDEEDEDEDDDDDESSDEEEKNGGPSDPSKTKKARKQAALEQILASMGDDEEEDGMDVDGEPQANGIEKKANKGKGKALDEDDEDDEDIEDDDDEEEEEEEGMTEVVICTLDPEKNYQQTLDITVSEDQEAYFKVSGTHAVYLTGNYVIPPDNGHSHGPDMYDDEDSDEDYDLEPDMDELDDEESDELDDMEDPRITEVDSDDATEVPKLVKKGDQAKKGKNKRPADDSEDEPANLDDIMAKSLKPEPVTAEPKLSKKQLKKLKKNDGKPAEAAAEETKETAKASDKKVQFAKNLEAPPSSSQSTLNGETKSKPGIKMVQGVKIDDKTIGKGPVAKKGNTVGMRYIGKLSDGKVFDANKKGLPFKFKLGGGDVIKGWDIGVAGMAVGGERRIVVPANLAYGSSGMPGIPKNSELTFDLKLLEVK